MPTVPNPSNPIFKVSFIFTSINSAILVTLFFPTFYRIEKAFVRNLETKQAQAEEYGLSLTTSIDDILEDKEIQIVVELMGTIEPAKTYS